MFRGRVNSENGLGKGRNQYNPRFVSGGAPRGQNAQQTTTASLAGSPMRKAMSGPISSNTKNKLKAFEFKKQKSAPSSPPTAKPTTRSFRPPVQAAAASSASSASSASVSASTSRPTLALTAAKQLSNPEAAKKEETSQSASNKKIAETPTRAGDTKPKPRRTASYNDSVSSGKKNSNYKDDFSDFPATPAPRIPLADLIPKNEKNPLVKDLFGDDKDNSPDERVMWKFSPAKPSKRPGQAKEGKSKTVKRKRAASSSPISTPQKNDRGPEQYVFDLQTIGSSLRTPNVDPAVDLWNRCSTLTSERPPAMAPLAPLANFLTSSSPRPANDSPLALRRSYSCGTEWPNKKRRVIANPSVARKEVSAIGLAAGVPGARSPRTSRLSILVEQIQKDMTRPDTKTTPNNSSSRGVSSHPDAEEDIISSPPTPVALNKEEEEEEEVKIQENVAESSDTDEFGDFDIDMEEVEIAMTAVDNFTRTQQPGTVQSEPEALLNQPEDRGDASTHAGGKTESQDTDEYGDDDDTFLGDDIELMISKYESANKVQAQAVFAQPAQTFLSNPPAQGSNTAQEPFSDDYGDFDADEWDVAELELSKGGKVGITENTDLSADTDGKTSGLKAERIQRLNVVTVMDSEVQDQSGQYAPQKVLLVRYEKTGSEYTVFLRQSWIETTVSAGDIINVVGDFNAKRSCVIDDARNFLILHPDILISSISVADTFECLRKAALQERVKATNDITEASLYGNILHELLQCSLTANDFSVRALNDQIHRIVSEHVQDFFALRVPLDTGIAHLKTKIPMLTEWANTYVAARPNVDAYAKGHLKGMDANICVKKVLDVEEHIWSPKFGLKGNIDVTAEVKVEDREGRNTWTAPLELKTGRNTQMPSHRAQAMLYTLLLSDRYDIQTFCSILYYLETAEVIRIPALRRELLGMIIGRNTLATYLSNKETLPPMKKDKHACKRCYAKDSCFIYHKAFENGTAESSGIGDVFEKKTAHLSKNHANFFAKWDNLLTKEEKDSETFRKELWIMQGYEREKVGRCFSNLSILPDSNTSATVSTSKINRYTYQFVKPGNSSTFSFLESQIHVGEPIVVSDELGHFALSKGYVTAITKRIITVAVDRRLHNIRSKKEGFHPERNQAFTGIMEVLDHGEEVTPIQPGQAEVQYRIDKDEFSAGLAMVRNNLVELMNEGTGNKLRKLIIDLEAPTFKYEPTAFSMPSESQGTINPDQKLAIEKVMSANDYALVLGMPGTGKTTTIAHTIRSLVKQGKSVLLTSYTHTAVDNILIKIKDDKIPILRLGVASKIHPDVRRFATVSDTHMTTFDEIREALFTPKVVATTCLSIKHQIFSERIFDYCIVDEASQITLPVCLGPLRMAKSFVLVGDHYQLPPLVRNPEAKAGGLDVSLFKLLSDAHPSAVVSLEHQYRMCKDIMTLSNTLIYSGRLKCGTEAVAKASLNIPNIGAIDKFHSPTSTQDPTSICGVTMKCWIKDLMNEQVKAAFVNTDALPALEERRGDRTYNPVEADLAFQLIEGFLQCGVPASEMGLISIYRSQLTSIQNLFNGRPPIEMHTADKFQGRDKECIIISLVRSNDQGKVGDLLTDWRRINVAFTRARTKLIILGSKSTLKSNELLGRFVDLMEENKWVYNLKKGANSLHHIPMPSTAQTENSSMGSPKRSSPKLLKKVPAAKINILKENMSNRNGITKAPAKTGAINKKAILASRPILRDIVNGCS